MGFVSGLIGTAGGANGSGFAAPQGASIQSPVTNGQATDAYKQTQDALDKQLAFLQATQAQNGLGNQTNVFNQLQNVANGTGPNPAQAQLAQATGANVANQAALMAGQRGAGANVGLIARQAAQQGAQTQQQAAGQAANLQAQQSMGALQGMGSLANQQAAQQAAATTGYSGAAQSEQSNLLNSIAGVNSANVGMQSNMNSANAALTQAEMAGQQNVMQGMSSAIGSAMGMMGGSKAEGGEVEAPNPNQIESTPSPTAAPASGGKSGGGGGLPIGALLALLADGGSVSSPSSKYVQMLQNSAPPASTGAISPVVPTPYEYLQQMMNMPPVSPPSMMPGGQTTTTTMTSTGPQSAVGKHFQSGGNSGFQSLFSGAGGQGAQGGFGNMIGKGINSLYHYLTDDPANGDSEWSGTTENTSNADNINGTDAQTESDKLDADTAVPSTDGDDSAGADSPSMDSGSPDDTMAAFAAAYGGKVPTLVSPGEHYLGPKEAKKVAKGQKKAFSTGERIPGKPMFKGNDYRNDIVPKSLQEGGVVIPNSIMQHKDAEKKAAEFVRQILAKSGRLPAKGSK